MNIHVVTLIILITMNPLSLLLEYFQKDAVNVQVVTFLILITMHS